MSLFFHEKTPDGFNARRVEEVLCHQKTKFQTVDIVRHEHLGRTLYLDSSFQADDNFQTEYHEVMCQVIKNPPAAPRILIAGSGPGGLAKAALSLNPMSINAVEIDAQAVELYKKYLPEWGVEDSRVREEIASIVNYTFRCWNLFDIVFWDIDADAMSEDEFWEPEFWRAMKSLLAPGGAFIATAGFIAERAETSPYSVLAQRLSETFPSGKFIEYPRLNWKFFSARI